MRLWSAVVLMCAGIVLAVSPAFVFVSRTDGTQVKTITGLGYVRDVAGAFEYDSGPWYSGLHFLGRTGGYVGLLGVILISVGLWLVFRGSIGAAVTGAVVGLAAAGIAIFSIANPQRVMDSPFLPATAIGGGLWAALLAALVAAAASAVALVATDRSRRVEVATPPGW